MSFLTCDFLLKHARAVVLIQVAGQTLSDLERELIEKVDRRRQAFGEAATATPAEQTVILTALTGMEDGLRQLFADNRGFLIERLARAARDMESAG